MSQDHSLSKYWYLAIDMRNLLGFRERDKQSGAEIDEWLLYSN